MAERRRRAPVFAAARRPSWDSSVEVAGARGEGGAAPTQPLARRLSSPKLRWRRPAWSDHCRGWWRQPKFRLRMPRPRSYGCTCGTSSARCGLQLYRRRFDTSPCSSRREISSAESTPSNSVVPGVRMGSDRWEDFDRSRGRWLVQPGSSHSRAKTASFRDIIASRARRRRSP